VNRAPSRTATGAHGFWARTWRARGPLACLLWPLGMLNCAAMSLRRRLFRAGLLTVERVPVPVIVIGNLTVGGTGKTPLVAWLASRLRAHGFKPGIVSRGYGAARIPGARVVDPDGDPALFGDEPVLLARESGVPVVVAADRVAAARRLLESGGVDVVLSDDGLQHLRLGRDVAIEVIDGDRRYGNGWCLPAGPMREPVGRAGNDILKVCHGDPRPGEFGMHLEPRGLVPVAAPDEAPRPVQALGASRVHAVAGIGNPERFFRALESQGLDVQAHAYPDHYPYNPGDLDFGDDLPVVMTAKDAVKCRRFARANWWFLAVSARVDTALETAVTARMGALQRGSKTA